MSYYASNQPYNSAHQQKDGNANGAIIGGLAGAGMAGGFHYGAPKATSSMLKDFKAAESAHNGTMSKMGSTAKEKQASLANFNEESGTKKKKWGDRINSAHKNTVGGGWKGKLAGYGGSALLGMGAGAGIDAMNK